MRLMYNKSGFNHTGALTRINSQAYKHNQYSTLEKIKILHVIEKMVQEDLLSYAQASSALGIDQSVISRWKKHRADFAAFSKHDKLSLHPGPISILKDIEEELISFVDEWHGKGLPVNRFILM